MDKSKDKKSCMKFGYNSWLILKLGSNKFDKINIKDSPILVRSYDPKGPRHFENFVKIQTFLSTFEFDKISSTFVDV